MKMKLDTRGNNAKFTSSFLSLETNGLLRLTSQNTTSGMWDGDMGILLSVFLPFQLS